MIQSGVNSKTVKMSLFCKLKERKIVVRPHWEGWSKQYVTAGYQTDLWGKRVGNIREIFSISMPHYVGKDTRVRLLQTSVLLQVIDSS